jgi:hypothetical protein
VGMNHTNLTVNWEPVYEALRYGKTFEDDRCLRAIRHLEDYLFPAHYYSVNRTEVWRTVWRHLLLRRSPPLLKELELELAFAFSGNVKVIPEVMWVRNHFEPPVGGTIARQKLEQVWEWWDADENASEKADFLQGMSELLTSLLGENQDCVRHEIDQVPALAFEGYVKTWRLRRNEAVASGDRFRGRYRQMLRRVLKFFLPQGISKPLTPQPALISDCVGPEANYDEALLADIGRRLLSARLVN